MYKHSKVFDLTHNQVLIQTEHHSENEEAPFALKQTVQNEDVVMHMSLDFEKKKDRDKNFNEYTKAKAAIFINAIIKMTGPGHFYNENEPSVPYRSIEEFEELIGNLTTIELKNLNSAVHKISKRSGI